MTRKTLAAAAVVLTCLALTACNDTERASGEPAKKIEGSAPDEIRVHTVTLPDDSKVLCIWEKDGYGGGLSCDWTNKTQPNTEGNR